MAARYCMVGGPDASEATLFHQAQVGCRDSLNRLMACLLSQLPLSSPASSAAQYPL